MSPKVVTFDCAQTLLEVDWSIRRYIADCAEEISLEIPLEGPALYESMYAERLADYVAVNMTRDHEACDRWWLKLGEDWLTSMGLAPERASDLKSASERIGFGPESRLFKIYDDVAPTLQHLQEEGIRIGVLSNWDYSLHKSLKGAGIYEDFEIVVASLEYGVEKPDPRLFQVVIDHFQVAPEEILHIGDNPIDDLEGALAVGMRAALIDRSVLHPSEPVINDLRQIAEVLSWNS